MEFICIMTNNKNISLIIRLYFGIICSMIMTSCGLFESNDDFSDKDGAEKVYVALQGLNKIGIININSGEVEEIDINYHSVDCSGFNNVTDCANNGCMWHDMGEMNSHCMSHGDSHSNHAPHFISIDQSNKYWFVTTMMSGWVGRYSLNTGNLIDKIFVGDSPALMAIDENKQILYVSRMMLMEDGQHGAQTSFIQTIDYSDPEKMVFKEPLDATIQGPHAVAINSDGSELYTATFEGDWLYQFMLEENNIRYTIPLETGYSLDINDPYPTKRMKPVQAVLVEDSLLILSCSAGKWVDNSGIWHDIPGQVHLWNVSSQPMERKDTFLFNWDSRPWHLIESPTSNRVFVVLKGEDYDIYPNSDGVACLSYTSEGMINDEPEWITRSVNFEELHGIDISDDGMTLFVSGFVDGKLHVLDAFSGELKESIYLGPRLETQAAGVKYLRQN